MTAIIIIISSSNHGNRQIFQCQRPKCILLHQCQRGQNTLHLSQRNQNILCYIRVKEAKIHCITSESKKPKYIVLPQCQRGQNTLHQSQRNQNTLCSIRAKMAKIHCITPESKQPVTYPGGVLHRRHASAVKLDDGLVFAHVVSSVGCQGILQDVCRGQSTVETAIRIVSTTGLLDADCCDNLHRWNLCYTGVFSLLFRFFTLFRRLFFLSLIHI